MNSPLAATAITLGATGLCSAIILLVRLLLTINTIKETVLGVAKDVSHIREDENIMRYSHFRTRVIRGRRNVR